jgi:hypothetical protein
VKQLEENFPNLRQEKDIQIKKAFRIPKDMSGGINRKGQEEREGKGSVKRVQVWYVCVYEASIMKPTEHCLNKEEKMERLGNIREGVDLFV